MQDLSLLPFKEIIMKRILLFLFCISMLAGCSQRHEALADGHMINNGEPPKNPVSVNTLYPGELKNVGKVENNTNDDVWYVYEEFLNGSYYDYGRYPYKKYHHPRKYRPKRYY